MAVVDTSLRYIATWMRGTSVTQVVIAQPHLLQQMQMAFTVRLLLLIFLLFLVPVSLFAQTNYGKVAVGASLSAIAGNNSSWLSPSGDFAFGFRQLENSDLFLLSVWYAKIPDRTLVWYAFGDSPAVVANGSLVNLTADNGLVLTSPQGVQLWKSESISGVVAFGVLNDTGNFVLEDDNSESLWETFNNPTHTILPGQDIEKGGKLLSQQSETNFSKGRFELRMQDDGNLVLVTINLPTEIANNPYYASDTTGDSNSSAGTKLEFSSSGYMYILRENGEKFTINKEAETVSTRSFYLRATLNFDGVFAKYAHPKNPTGNVSWSIVSSVPDNICSTTTVEYSGLAVCGLNSICILQDQRPTCECPPGYSLLDSNDPNGNCKPGFVPSCEDELNSTTDIYEVQMLNNADWPNSDFLQFPSTPERCNQSCFEDCLCAVAIYRIETCWKKKLPLSNGRVDSRLNSQAFIKVSKGNSTQQVPQTPNPDDRKKTIKSRTSMPVESILLGTSGFVNFMLIAAVCLGCLFIFRKNHVRCTQNDLDTNLHSFSYKELEEATNGFEEELGRGSFGVVYKGEIETSSGVEVAVKKLSSLMQDSEKEFKTEVNIIGRTHHKNLVHLFGYCEEGQQRMLVYEFLSNGTLASFLFADTRPSWRLRIEIAYGVAKGLLYLHEQCSTQIIHCDIKPQNILLDDYYNARISDFGLAKLLMMNQSKTHTVIRGTKGYVAPEWFRNMPITTKVDVYSFGVVLLEVICCRRSVDMENNTDKRAILTDWVYDCYREGLLEAIVDNEIEALHEKTKLERFVMVAIWCIQEDPLLRPTMKTVVRMLEGVVEVKNPPCPSPYSRIG